MDIKNSSSGAEPAPAEKNRNLKTCKHCGAEIAANAKVCPHCGGKNKKPFYLRPWFIILVLLVLFGILGSSGGKSGDDAPSSSGAPVEETDTAAPEPAITYTAYDVSTLMDDLDSNPLNASNKYQDQYVTLTGRLSVIDSSGEYISIVDADDEWAILDVYCSIQDDAQLDAVSQLSIGDIIVVSGQITDVGEVLGYFLDITDIQLPG